MASINYAKLTGYASLPAAIVFSILYVPLFIWFVIRSFALPTYVHFVMAFFCLIRVSAFVLRAVLASSDSAGTSLGAVVADQVLFGVGYFGLLYSAYILVLNLEEVVNNRDARDIPLIRLTKNRHAFRLLMTIAVALGIASSSMTRTDGTSSSTSTSLREASTIIFLILTALLVLQTVYFAHLKIINPQAPISSTRQASFGAKHGIFILTVVSLLLLVREAFTTATMTPSTHAKQYNEHYWYPFVATTEILAVFCYLAPGLVPSAKEIRERSATHHEYELKRGSSP